MVSEKSCTFASSNRTEEMDKEAYITLKALISESVRTAIREEFSHYMRLDEMARVGFMDNFDVIIHTDDMGFIPHFHIIDKATRGYEFNCCVRLENNQYFSHGNHKDKLNSKQRRMLNDFMNAPHRNIHYRNNYEYAVNLWNDNNSSSYVQIMEDANGNVIVPNYTEIAEG